MPRAFWHWPVGAGRFSCALGNIIRFTRNSLAGGVWAGATRKEPAMDHLDQFIPHLCVSDGMKALEFYKSVFGAEEGGRVMSPDGRKLVHGEIVLGQHKCFLSDEFPQEEGGTVKTPQSLGGTCVRITLSVDDADGLVARAVAAGAK